MNTPINIGSIFKDEWFQFKQPLSYDKYEYIVVYLDPSFKKEADYKAVLTLGFVNKEYHILDIYLRRQTMNNVIEYLYNLNDKLLKAPYSMYYEANFAQDLHQREFNEIADKKGYKLPIIQDKDRKDNKQARIESMSVVFENRDIFISNLLEYSNDYKEFKNQMLSFPSKGVNDDGSDALQSAYVKLNLFIRKMRNDIMYGTDDRLMHF
jgi:predicted phage terminase large subunit-like protein